MTNGGLLFVGVPGAQSDDERANSKVRITHMEREKAGVFTVNRDVQKGQHGTKRNNDKENDMGGREYRSYASTESLCSSSNFGRAS